MDTQPPPTGATQTHDSQAVAVKLLEDLELTNIPDEQKQELTQKVAELVDKEIMYAVMSRLTDEDVVELETLLDSQEGEEPFNDQTFQFLQDKIPNLGQLIEDSIVAVYDRLDDANTILSS